MRIPRHELLNCMGSALRRFAQLVEQSHSRNAKSQRIIFDAYSATSTKSIPRLTFRIRESFPELFVTVFTAANGTHFATHFQQWAAMFLPWQAIFSVRGGKYHEKVANRHLVFGYGRRTVVRHRG